MANNVIDMTLERITINPGEKIGREDGSVDNVLIELKSTLNNPYPTSESLISVEKLARSTLEPTRLEELANSPYIKDIPIDSLITCIEAYRRDEKCVDVFVRFLAFLLSVYTKDENYLLSQPVSERLVLLAKELYSESGINEHITEFYVMSSKCFIREPSTIISQDTLTFSILTFYTELFFSYSEQSPQIMCLLLTAISEFITKLPKLFIDTGGIENIPFLLLILKENISERSVCLASLVLLRNALIHSASLKHNGDFLSLPNDFLAILNAYPRDIDITREILAVLSDFLQARSEITSELTNVTHPLTAYCISILKYEECSINLQFNVCQYFSILIPSFTMVEEKALIARLVLKCITRAKNENRYLNAYVLGAATSIVQCFPVSTLSKDSTDNATALSLTYSEFQDLLAVTLSHTDNSDVLLQNVLILHSIMELSSNMSYTTELLRGLKYPLVHFFKTWEEMAVRIILQLIYSIDTEDRKQAQALEDSEIITSLTECLSRETDPNMIEMLVIIITTIIDCYQMFHEHIVDLLFQQVPASAKESLNRVIGYRFMKLTSNNSSKVSMYEHGIVENMLRYISSSDLYTSTSLPAIIYGMANIAIDSDKAKNTMSELGLHIFLIDLVQRISTEFIPDWKLYRACIRCLHVLSSRDEVKEAILQSDSVEYITSLISRNTTVIVAMCSSFIFFAKLGYTNLPDKKKLFSKQVYELVSTQMKETDHARVFYCGCSFFSLMFRDDMGVRYIGDLQLDEVIFNAINRPFLAADKDKFKKCFNCLDKFVCHIIPRPISLSLTETPLPDSTDNFIVHRHYCTTRNNCSNCDADAPRSELVMRPDSVTLEQYQLLVNNGWYRRGAVKMFRFNLQHKRVCIDWETRVRVKEFDINSSRTFKRVLKKVPKGVVIETVPARFTQEGFELYNRYNQEKHGKDPKSPEGYTQHAVQTPLRPESRDGVNYGTYHQEYRLNGKLIAIGVIDVILEGIVSIYFYFDMTKEISKLSLGVYSSLKEIEFVQSLNAINPNIKYYYIQGWNGPNHKLAYKNNYKPIEFCSPCVSPYWTDSIDIPFVQTGFLSSLPEGKIPLELTNVNSTQPDLLLDSEYAYKPINIDRGYQSEVHHLELKGSDVRVFLNGEIMTCGELLERYSVYSETRQYICESFEELALAVGYPLCNKLLVVFMFSEYMSGMEKQCYSMV